MNDKPKRKFLPDFIFLALLVGITTIVYNFLFKLSPQAVIGDMQRYNGYQAYFIKYSLTNFGQLGLWDPFLSSGMSWISHPGGALFSPGAWLVTLLTSDITQGSVILFYIHALSASFAFYFLCRVLGLRKFSSFIIAIIAVCNQYIFIFAANGWFEEFFGVTLLPLTVGLFWLSLSKGKYLYAVLGAFVMSLNFFSNSYYVFHYNAMCILFVGLAFFIRDLFFTFKKKEKARYNLLKNIYSHVIFWIVTIGISAIKLLPLLEFRNISARNTLPLSIIETPDGVMTFSFFQNLFRNFIIPAGHTDGFTRWTNNLGLLFVCITLLYVLVKKPFVYIVFLGLLILGIWGYFAYRMPIDLYAFFYNFLPGFNSNNYPYRFIIIINFAFLMCVALGLDILFRQKNKFLSFSGFFLGTILAVGAASYTYNSYNALSYPQTIDVRHELDKTKLSVVKPPNLTAPPVIKGESHYLLINLLKIFNEYKPEGRVYSTFSSADKNPLLNNIILENEIPVVHHSYEPIVPTYEYGITPHGSTQDDLSVTQKRYKIFSVLNTRFTLQERGYSEYEGCRNLELLKSNKDSLEASGPAPKDGVCEYLENRIFPLIIREDGGIYYNSDVLPKVALIENPILLISDNRFNDFSGFIAKQIMFHQDFDLYSSTVFSGGSPYVDDYSVEALRKFPIIILVEPKIKDKENVDRKIREYAKYGGKVIALSSAWKYYQNLHIRHTSFFTKLPAWTYSESDAEVLSDVFKSLRTKKKIGTVDIKKNTPEDIVFKVKTVNDNAALQFSDSFYPGWKAMIDEKATELYMADGLVKGVVIPKTGEHTVRFYYDPDSFKKGAIISGITLVVVCSAFIYNLRKRRKIKK